MREIDQIKQDVITAMKELGVYKEQYNETINIFVDMIHQYESLTKQFKEGGYEVTEEHTNAVGAVNTKKRPILTAIEKLRVDIATYSNILCLNPRHLRESVAKEKQSSITELLEKMGG